MRPFRHGQGTDSSAIAGGVFPETPGHQGGFVAELIRSVDAIAIRCGRIRGLGGNSDGEVIVAVVHENGKRPLEQGRGDDQVVLDLVAGHVTHGELKTARRGQDGDRLLGARAGIQA